MRNVLPNVAAVLGVALAVACVTAIDWVQGMHCLGDDGVLDGGRPGSSAYRFCEGLDDRHAVPRGTRALVDLWVWAPIALLGAALVALLASAAVKARRRALLRGALAAAALGTLTALAPAVVL